jgi:hypothetical protein
MAFTQMGYNLSGIKTSTHRVVAFGFNSSRLDGGLGITYANVRIK